MQVCGFEFPDDLHYHVEEQVWARLEGEGFATVGITALGIGLAGEIYMCRPKAPGSKVMQGHAVAVVELAKSIVSVKSPVSGIVVEVNARLADTPGIVHVDPYRTGWIARLRMSDFAADAARLVHDDGVAAAMREHARLYNIS
jgi:glycine cleavage system H protein